MTGPYEWNPMPHVLDVRCPACAGPAVFEFVELVRIRRREDIPYFVASSQLDYRSMDGGVHGRWHAALYNALLHGPPETTLRDLPEGYAPADFAHSRYLYRGHGLDEGAVACSGCGHRARHCLSWPDDARFRVELRGAVLWAFHRESAVELRSYIASTDRRRAGRRWEAMLRHVPAIFLGAKVRATVVKRLDRLLA